MQRITLLVPLALGVPPEFAERAVVVRYTTVADIQAAMASGTGPVVLLSDGLSDSNVTTAADAVRAAAMTVIEVRSERWDGASYSELSAACRGVISGFGADGILAALALLEREAAPVP